MIQTKSKQPLDQINTGANRIVSVGLKKNMMKSNYLAPEPPISPAPTSGTVSQVNIK